MTQSHGNGMWRDGSYETRLLASVAEQLKVPLLHIARQAELAAMPDAPLNMTDACNFIQQRADAAMRLVDSYLLGLELLGSQMQLELEPVSVASILYDTAHHLSKTAKQYGVSLELHIAGRYGPVMAHPRGLQAALLSLGYACIEAQPSADRPLKLVTHRSSGGIRLGVYGIADDVRDASLRQGRKLAGRAAQPFVDFSGGPAAGVYVADVIFEAMATRLSVSRHQSLSGLSAVLQPSQQLQLV
jgi:hypothetical protein